jgi:ribosome-binding factor A
MKPVNIISKDDCPVCNGPCISNLEEEMNTSKVVEAARVVFVAAGKAYTDIQKSNQVKMQEFDKTLRVAETIVREAYDKASRELGRLKNIEKERDKIQQEIYIRTVKEHAAEAAYTKSLKEANEFIQNKYGEDLG